MRLLALSTAEQCCSLAVMDHTALLCEEFWNSRVTHSRRLVQMISHALDSRAGLKLDELDGFVAAKGPGSFTGLRIGISVIQALAYSMEKPALGVSSLDGIAFRFSFASQPVCVMMDARRNEVYSAVYRFEKGCLISKTKETVSSPEKAVGRSGKNSLFAGTGSKVYKKIVEASAPENSISDPSMDCVSAAAMVQSLYGDPEFCDDPGNILLPSYIRKSDAELQFAEKQR